MRAVLSTLQSEDEEVECALVPFLQAYVSKLRSSQKRGSPISQVLPNHQMLKLAPQEKSCAGLNGQATHTCVPGVQHACLYFDTFLQLTSITFVSQVSASACACRHMEQAHSHSIRCMQLNFIMVA